MITEIESRLSAIPTTTLLLNEESIQDSHLDGIVIVLADIDYDHRPREMAIKSFMDCDTTLSFSISLYGLCEDGNFITKAEEMRNLIRTNLDLSRVGTYSQMFRPVSTTFNFDQNTQLVNTVMEYQITFTETFGTP